MTEFIIGYWPSAIGYWFPGHHPRSGRGIVFVAPLVLAAKTGTGTGPGP